MDIAEFVLLFDPETESFFSYSEEKGILVHQRPPKFVERLVAEQHEQMRKLIEKKRWNKLNDYQKRPIPRYFINERKYKYPVYITQQNMPQALLQNKVTKNAMIMNGNRIPLNKNNSGQNSRMNGSGNAQPGNNSKNKELFIDKVNVRIHLNHLMPQLKGSQTKEIPESLTFDVKLLISANEVIRTACRMILHDFDVVITTKNSRNKLIFKVLDRNQFIYGNQPFLKFQTIREAIKNARGINLQMIQTEITDKAQFRKFVFSRDPEEMEKGNFTPFPWETLQQMNPQKKISASGVKQKDSNDMWQTDGKYLFLMWYKPDLYFIDPMSYIKQELCQTVDGKARTSSTGSSSIELQKNYQQSRLKIQIMKKQLQEKVPRYIWKERIFNFLEERRQYIREKLVDLQGSTIYTGECPFVFSFNITGLSNFSALFRSNFDTNRQITYRQKGFMKFTGKEVAESNYPRSLNSPFERNRRFTQTKRKGQFAIVPYQISVLAEFYYNGEKLGDKTHSYQTCPVLAHEKVIKMDETFEWILLSKIMLETNIVFTVKVFSKQGATIVGGMGVLKMFDEYGYLRQGDQQIQILALEKLNTNKIGCMDKIFDLKDSVTTVKVRMPKFRQPVRWSLEDRVSLKLLGYLPQPVKKTEELPMSEVLQKVTDILNVNPIQMLKYDAKQKQILHSARKYYSHQSSKLINYLLSVDWTEPTQIHEAYQALHQWKALTPIQGLLLMNRHISDQKARLFAMQAFEKVQEYEMVLYANQATQALVSFQTHQNPLIDFIIEKSCQNPYQIGQEYFWQFRNRITDPVIGYRFTMYLETLVLTSPIRSNFYGQVLTNDRLLTFNFDMVKKVGKNSKYEDKRRYFKSQVPQLEAYLKGTRDIGIKPQMGHLSVGSGMNMEQILSRNFIFPIRPQNCYDTILPEQSTVFDSKKMPFNLSCVNFRTFKSFNLHPYRVMFKEGDDIKQDHLVLQILRIFDDLWLEAGCNFQMNIYKVLPTGDQIGFIQLVEDSVNISKIHNESDGFIGAFDKEATFKFIKDQNIENDKLKLEEFNLARENFRKSCAGYLVATYVLGIADRHSGNIMLQKKSGRIFHIDFGHILGNFKHKVGIKRQRTPFIFTSEQAFVMDGPQSALFQKFEKDCTDAYNILRRNGKLIISLLMCMIAADIPELQSYKDIQYVVKNLALDLSESQASEKIIREIRETLQNQQSQNINNVFHQLNKQQC